MNPIIDGIIALEGGYVFNPKDKGGATHWGITEATARAHGYAGDMRDLTHAEAYAILEEDYLTSSRRYRGQSPSSCAMRQST